jgi:hypothetical protein
MSNENSDKDLAGTANALRQQSVYRELSELYTPEGANLLASVNLKRNGVDVPPEGVGHWNTVNEAAHAGKMDLEAEAAIAAAKVNALTDAMLGRSDVTPPTAALDNQPAAELEEEEEEEEDDEEEGGEEPGNERYGYDNADDNDEAALDDIHKLNDM